MEFGFENVKAAVLHGQKDLRLLPPGPTEVQVAIRSTATSSSDLHYFNHFQNGHNIIWDPLTLGHESSGTVVNVGSDVTNFTRGDNVSVEVCTNCPGCEYCHGENYNLCQSMRLPKHTESYPYVKGTLQERINHPVRRCHKLPKDFSLDQSALIEPLSIAINACDRADLPNHATVLVLGAGPLGLLCAAMAKVGGAKDIVIVDSQDERNHFAEARGFAGSSVPIVSEVPQSTHGKLKYAQDMVNFVKEKHKEPDAVFECTGTEMCLQAAIYAAKPGGKVMMVGPGTPIMTVPISTALFREVSLIGVFRSANTYPRAIDLLSNPPANMPNLAKLISHRHRNMESIGEALVMAGRVKDQNGKLVNKVVVDMDMEYNKYRVLKTMDPNHPTYGLRSN